MKEKETWVYERNNFSRSHVLILTVMQLYPLKNRIMLQRDKFLQHKKKRAKIE